MRRILLGAGGHGVVAAALASACGRPVTDIIDPDPSTEARVPGARWLAAEDDEVLALAAEEVELVNGVGANGPAGARRRLFERLSEAGYHFPALIHPFSWVAPTAVISEGVQIMAGAVVQPGAAIGRNVIVNTRASVDHDCRIADHVHIAPGSTICGSVSIGEGAMIGAGAVVIPGLAIGAGAMIGAGAAVCRDVPEKALARGVPARQSV